MPSPATARCTRCCSRRCAIADPTLETYHADGAALCFRRSDAGSATAAPAVLLHGLGGAPEDWDAVVPAFADRPLVLPDLRGFAGSREAPGPYSVPRCAQDLHALFEHLELDRADLIGHSMGGAVALQFALDHPERVRRLVLINSLADYRLHGPGRWFEYLRRRLVIAVRGLPALARSMVARSFPREDQAELRAAVTARYAANSERVYVQALRGIVHWSVAERLGALGVPTLVVAGELDLSPVADKQAMVDAMPDAQLAVIPGSRHGTPIGAADALVPILRGFLDRD